MPPVSVGLFVGVREPLPLGSIEGYKLGVSEGNFDGRNNGLSVGFVIGVCDGIFVGFTDGLIVGFMNGESEGLKVGLHDGVSLGFLVKVGFLVNVGAKPKCNEEKINLQERVLQMMDDLKKEC